ncbi:hypothetical protein CHLNCDRAFT_135739 [Chlorella variabilis]|uniref:Uncharacterized protein n=1 Tax=Chlorella variabilis TaxID=554065 RepID=E1ZIW6_CHLVA|nr:hypothetical protein CHLNCDRAFT_135739 [Chlorella variabilis]EFN54229.1 hypothetical protein CHLNCDRAFT_135739 [Chlorella variabilis]|eukprot:XP_005846331.1 hypothetical protein CHLNCDRAFT_135739 [Chlorella variabilis]
MANFKTKLSNFQGYDELNTLERPLVSDVHEQEEYERQHGVGSAAGGYRPPPSGAEYYPSQPTAASGYPPPPGAAGYPPPPGAAGAARVDELQELSLLARDAAEILWEMVAMGEGGAAVEDMKSKAYQLQAQLRGLIGDYQGGDEGIFAKAFESFDMLSRCLEEQTVNRPTGDEAPLISFD